MDQNNGLLRIYSEVLAKNRNIFNFQNQKQIDINSRFKFCSEYYTYYSVFCKLIFWWGLVPSLHIYQVKSFPSWYKTNIPSIQITSCILMNLTSDTLWSQWVFFSYCILRKMHSFNSALKVFVILTCCFYKLHWA